MTERDLALATRIHLAVKDSCMTQAEFADAIEITPDKLSKVLSGKRRVSSLELALIAQASGWSVEKLLGIHIDVTGYQDGYRDAIRDAVRALEAGRIATFLAESPFFAAGVDQ